ncbi:MAG: DUF3841 domain-containing protein [bacterium]|nr:DUF3841 domain-containing protein [bacterium]
MRFWTIQPRTIWDQMQRGESVRVDPENSRYQGRRPWQYDWLATALADSHPGFDGGWPWWLSCIEPDLRQQRQAELPGGTAQTVLELELPPERYVTFPLWMWETIHLGHYLAANEDELSQWQANAGNRPHEPSAPDSPGAMSGSLDTSWRRLLDVRWRPRFWYRDVEISADGSSLSRLMNEASEEAVGLTQELRADDVLSAASFRTDGPTD